MVIGRVSACAMTPRVEIGVQMTTTLTGDGALGEEMYSAEVPSRFGYSGISGSSDSLPVAVTVRKMGYVTPPTNYRQRCSRLVILHLKNWIFLYNTQME